MADEVPVLPVVVPMAALVFAVLLSRLRTMGRLTTERVAVALVLCVYLAGIVANTVFPIPLEHAAGDRPWSAGLALAPFSDYEARDALINVAVFAPLGALLGAMLGPGSSGRALAIAAVCSLGIEATQYLTAHLLGGGHIADTDDLLANILGAAVGLGALRLLTRVQRARSALHRLRWNGPH